MSDDRYYAALDQGTTSSRAVLYNASGEELRICSKPLAVEFPREGWVEQNPADIWTTQLAVLKEVTTDISPEKIRAIGISNHIPLIGILHVFRG